MATNRNIIWWGVAMVAQVALAFEVRTFIMVMHRLYDQGLKLPLYAFPQALQTLLAWPTEVVGLLLCLVLPGLASGIARVCSRSFLTVSLGLDVVFIVMLIRIISSPLQSITYNLGG